MPNRNGTGPMGAGALTGRGLGGCTAASTEVAVPVAGLGCRRRAGCGRKQGFGFRYGQAGFTQDTAANEQPAQRRYLRAGKGYRKFQ